MACASARRLAATPTAKASNALEAKSKLPIITQQLRAVCNQRVDAARFTCCLATTCDSPATVVAGAVEVHFSIPYRVNFGQSMAIIGSSFELGAWETSGRVRMNWSEGDVWKAKVDTESSYLEYKYVIVDGDGNISLWKPGGNFEIDMEGFSGKVQVGDTWDGTLHEIETSGNWEGPRAPLHSLPPSISIATAPELQTTNLEIEEEESDEYDAALKLELQKAYGELENTLKTSLELAEDADPADPRLLRNDQKLAAVHRRATSLSRAIDAGAQPPAYILKEIQRQEVDEN